ncbi:uncharacterized protein LOC134227748 isoform X2 [Armigeres subalbatus]|uniref:uncharacterized protein LOC134227748 isoform X2 n=1 Tax=Armigeres subalbatus TaxID=124917 RepID=UPI002ECFB2FE
MVTDVAEGIDFKHVYTFTTLAAKSVNGMAHLWNASTTTLVMLVVAACVVNSMHIPEDMEILDGYNMESAGTEINPEEDFYEQRSLLEPLYYRAIRDKREIPYRVLESPGLRSHFRPQTDDQDLHHRRNRLVHKRQRRSTTSGSDDATEETKPTEELPIPEHQRMDERTMESWAKTPYQVKKPAKEEEIDSEAEASMMSEGIKARAPRVNFVTQKKFSSDQSEAREDKEKIIPELYRKPLARLFYEYPAVPRAYDSYSAHSQSPMYPKIYNKYDEYHRDMMDRMHPPAPHRFDMYYQRRYDNDYDSYFPRYSFPSYYYYPDKRFDVPSYYRDRNYLLTNDVMDQPVIPPSTYIPSRNRRIIYYATLPEVVRTPPNVDLRYRNYNKYPNRYDPFYPTKAPYKVSTERNPTGDRKDDKYVSSTPIKIVRDLEAQQETPGSNNSAGRREYSVNVGGGSRNNNYHNDGDRSYYGRHH